MTAMKDAAAEFLGHKRVAVTGVSRTPAKPRQQRRLQAPARARLRGLRGQPERGRGRGRPLPTTTCARSPEESRRS